MIKQISLISLAVCMFIAVWVVVILQFNQSSSTKYSVAVSAEEARTSNANVSREEAERPFPFPETILEAEEIVEEDKMKNVEVEIKEKQVVKHDNEPVSESSSKKINLRDYDFSDISTSDGVPIDGILEKLDIK